MHVCAKGLYGDDVIANLNWESLRCLIAVARSGTISAASKELDLSVAAVSRRLDRLEAELNVKLLHRGPQGASVTAEGEKILRLAKAGARQFDEIERLAKELSSRDFIQPVRISATEPIAADVLAPRLPRLMRAVPDIRIELVISTENANLNMGEADIALRLADPKDDGIIARRLAAIHLGLFCSREYLAGRDPASIDLKQERLLWLNDAYGRIPENQWLTSQGLDSNVVLRSSSTRALLQAASAGSGIAMGAPSIAMAADLIEVSSEGLPSRQPWLLFHRSNKNSESHRAVRDWIVNSCVEAFGN